MLNRNIEKTTYENSIVPVLFEIRVAINLFSNAANALRLIAVPASLHFTSLENIRNCQQNIQAHFKKFGFYIFFSLFLSASIR